MDGVSPSHDQWLTLSLSTVPQPQPQPIPQPQLLPLFQTQPQPPSLPALFHNTPLVSPIRIFSPPQEHEPHPQPSSLLAPFHYMPLVAPIRPLFSPPQEQEPHQERYFLAPSIFPPPPSPSHVHDLPDMRLIPRCDLSLQEDQDQDAGETSQGRKRKQPTRAMKKGKAKTIDPPFLWATTSRATVHTLDHLLARDIKSISGAVKCKGCREEYDIECDLEAKFHEVARFVLRNKCNMHDRAPDAWNNPVLPTCKRCGQENSLRPVFAKKRHTNWLFLLLGQMIGCCKLSHLKYFCKHTSNHSTAAKDRLVYLTYLGLCKQLQPQGPFDP